jgi:hypothetical protein
MNNSRIATLMIDPGINDLADSWRILAPLFRSRDAVFGGIAVIIWGFPAGRRHLRSCDIKKAPLLTYLSPLDMLQATIQMELLLRSPVLARKSTLRQYRPQLRLLSRKDPSVHLAQLQTGGTTLPACTCCWSFAALAIA